MPRPDLPLLVSAVKRKAHYRKLSRDTAERMAAFVRLLNRYPEHGGINKAVEELGISRETARVYERHLVETGRCRRCGQPRMTFTDEDTPIEKDTTP